MRRAIIFLSLVPSLVFGDARSKALYNSLDPTSVSQHLALYELYPNTPEGQRALRDGWQLLSGERSEMPQTLPIQKVLTDAIIALVNKQPNAAPPSLTESELSTIEKIGRKLANRKLKGFYATTESEVLDLPPDQIDLARGLFLSEPEAPDWIQVKRYEAMLDLMALQVLAKLSVNATPQEKVRALNRFIFKDLHYKFPPHSLYAKDIDIYTFLPSVLDSRKGVCLGVSILYLCIAQRIDLPLEVITPPGHIFIRFRDGNEVINIETTAFGIHIDTEDYLNVGTRKLEVRDIKEVVGMAHINHASIFLQQEKYQDALDAYRRAVKYMPRDPLVQELMGYSLLFTGQEEEARERLSAVKDVLPDYAVTRDTMIEDYLSGKVDAEGIQTVFQHVDETRASILEKKDALERVIKKFPEFKNGVFSLGIAWLQLHRLGEGLVWLKRYHELHPNDPNGEYILAAVYGQRMDYPNALKHLQNAERITKERDHNPKALKTLRRELQILYPD